MNFEAINWAVASFALIGTVLNIKRRKEGFIIWLLTNSWWCWYDYRIGSNAQSALFAIYALLAAWGIYEWTIEKIEPISNDSIPDGSIKMTEDPIKMYDKQWGKKR